jgi:uncharacterized protein (DUF934 family)
MATIIKNGRLARDDWRLLEPSPDGALSSIPPQGDVIVPLALWQRERANLLSRQARAGVWLQGNEGPEPLAEDLERLALIAIHFAKFTDGRGYSSARLLRERYGYRGEIRAIGDVQRDQLLYLSRCGFDAFAMKEAHDPEAVFAAFSEFTEAYQAAVDRPWPLFRRRVAAVKSGVEER